MDEKIFNKMENYLLGKLSAEEAAGFEQEMVEDETLRNEVEQQKKLMGAIETEGVRQLLDQIHEQHFAEENTNKETAKVVSFTPSKWRNTFAIAASISLLLVAGWWIISQDFNSNAGYASYFEPATGLPTTLGATDDPRFAEGMVSYKMKNFNEAMSYWQPLLETSAGNDTLNYFAGIALLAKDQPKQAIERLQQVIQQPNSAFYTGSQWYLALAYLFDNQKELAKELLKGLAERPNPYEQKSKEILKRME